MTPTATREGSSASEEGGNGGGGIGTPPLRPLGTGGGDGEGPPLEQDPLRAWAQDLRDQDLETRIKALVRTAEHLLKLAVQGGVFLAGWKRRQQLAAAWDDAFDDEAGLEKALDFRELTVERMRGAGLTTIQLDLKLEALADSLEDLSDKGGDGASGGHWAGPVWS
jgi:hypothetical protein